MKKILSTPVGYGKRIAKGGLWLFALTIIATALGYGTRLFLARNLSTETFGLFYSVSAFIGLFWAFKDLGYASAIAKYIPEWIVRKKSDNVNRLVWFGIAFQTAIGIAIFALLFVGADYLSMVFFKNPDAKLVLQILALEFLVAIVFLRQIMLGFQKILPYSSVDILRNAIVLALVIPLIGLGAVGISISYLVASLMVQTVFLYYIFSRLIPFKPQLKFGGPENLALKFGLVSFVSTLTGYIMSYADTILLTGMKSLVDVGLYQAALPTSQLLLVFATSVAVVMMPIFSEMWAKGDRANISGGLGLALKIMLILMIGPVLVVATWPDLIITMLFGAKFVSAAGALQILAFGAVFYSLALIGSSSLSAIGKPGAATTIWVIAGVSNLILNILLIPVFGIKGAASAAVLTYIIGFLVSAYYLKKFIGVQAPFATLLKAIVAGIVTILVAGMIKNYLIMNLWVETAITITATFASYLLLLKFFHALNQKDLAALDSMGIKIPNIARKLFG